MAKSKSIEDWKEEVDTLQRTYEEVSGTEIPNTIKEARDSKWELAVKGVAVAGLVPYAMEERRLDGQRVIPLPVALSIVEAFEDNLILTTIKNPKQLFISLTRFQAGIVRHAGTALGFMWDVIKLAWESQSLIDLIINLPEILGYIISSIVEIVTRFGALILSALVASVGINVFQKTVIDVQRERERWVGLARKRALPQRTVNRVWRRKVSRL